MSSRAKPAALVQKGSLKTEATKKIPSRPFAHKDEGKSLVQEEVESFASTTSFHGIRMWLNRENDYWYRILYLIIWLAFLVYTVLLVQSNVARYLEFNISVTSEKVFQETIGLPSLTVCPTHTYAKSKIGGEKDFLMGIMGPARPDVDILRSCYNSSIKMVNATTREYWESGLRLRDGFDNLWLRFEDIFVECQLFGEARNCSELFFGHYTTSGRCFTFNFHGEFVSTKNSMVWNYLQGHEGKKFIAKNNGVENSVHLKLNWLENEYCMGEMDDKIGFRILIHDPKVLPPFMDGSVLVTPGKSHEIGVKLTTIDKKKVENLGRCTFHYALPLYGELPYSKENCVLECLAELVFEQCACLLKYLPFDATDMSTILQAKFPNVSSSPGYETGRFIPCFEQTVCERKIVRAYKKGSTSVTGNCPTECPEPCFQEYFTISQLSSAEFRMGENTDRIKNRTGYTTDEEIRRNIVDVSVFYHSMRVTKVVENWDFRLFDLISNLGGTFGLFMGASLFSLVEIFDLILRLCIRGWKTESKPNTTSPTSATVAVKPQE